MGRRSRKDGPGVWHHVANRGIAKRSVFEGVPDVRYFLSRIARAYRHGVLEVYAYCLMITHFHLLVRSPSGRLSDAMRVVQNPFVRWFNRSRRRDGPLFRGRFLSRPVVSETDWWTVFRYIHFNPVKAGIVKLPEEYPHSSASHLIRNGPQPRWLLRRRESDGSQTAPTSPLEEPLSTPEAAIVEKRLSVRAPMQDDPLDMLLSGAPSLVRAWLKNKAELADNTSPALPVATPEILLDVVSAAERSRPDLTLKPGRKAVSLWPIILAGLLKQTCGLTLLEIAVRTHCSPATAHIRHREHCRQLLMSTTYATLATELVRDTVRLANAPVHRIRTETQRPE